jgi:hypothetical protein
MMRENTMKGSQIFGWIVASVFVLLAVPALSASNLIRGGAQATPKPRHVFIIVLENEGYHATFGTRSPATYLRTLALRGALLTNYYGIGHYSLPNYIAMVSGQAPNPITQSDCQNFVEFSQTGTTKGGQAIGAGCVYPSSVSTIVNQLEAKRLTWKGYMEDMGNIPSRESATCGHPVIGQPDGTQLAVQGDQYASRHNPFVYFHKIIDVPSCATHVVNLSELATDLQEIQTTPNYVFITPNLCHDGHDGGEGDKKCVDGQPGGLVSADKFLEDVVPKILASPAYQHDGLLIVTFDEADIEINFEQSPNKPKFVSGDPSACCHEQPGPNIKPGAKVFGKVPDKGPGIVGPGGGRIGAVLVSRFIKPGTVSKTPYNHYSLLRSIEDFFDVGYLGYAGQKGLKSFGKDIFTRPNGSASAHLVLGART